VRESDLSVSFLRAEKRIGKRKNRALSSIYIDRWSERAKGREA